MRATSDARPSRRAGFTLLEIVVAMMIFFLIITFAFWTMSQSVDQALSAERSRELRLLVERKLGEVAVFQEHYGQYDDQDGDFSDLPEGMRERFEGWTWKVHVETKTAFLTGDEGAPALFDGSGTGTTSTTTTDEAAKAAAAKSVKLTEFVLTVTAPGDDGGTGDSVEVVTYLPEDPKPATGTAAPGAPGGGR
jgi:prepilin-type N-terminal cleavage/methylation domain-containing protein